MYTSADLSTMPQCPSVCPPAPCGPRYVTVQQPPRTVCRKDIVYCKRSVIDKHVLPCTKTICEPKLIYTPRTICEPIVIWKKRVIPCPRVLWYKKIVPDPKVKSKRKKTCFLEKSLNNIFFYIGCLYNTCY